MLPAWSVKASIVIPCYNHGQYLREALESALRSDFDGYEVIVVDDGSTDEDTLSIIEELKSQLNRRQNVTFLRQENQGLAAARNNGIMAARGEYILPLDADNRIRPNYLRKAIEILDNDPSIGVVYAYAKYIGEKNGFWEFPAFDARKLLLGNFVEACSVLRKSVWEDCNGYDPDMGIMGYEDWDLWIGAMERGWKFHLIKEALFDYRIVKGSMIAGCNVTENRRHLIKYICNKHRDTYVKNLGYVVAEKDVSVLEVGVLVSNLEKHAGNLEVALRHRDARVSDLETHSRNLEEVLRQKDTHIDNLEVALRHRDTRVSDLETHSSNLEEVLRQRDTHIGNIEEVLRQRDTHIGSLEEVLRHRDSRIGDLETHSRNLQEVLRQRDTHIGNIEEVLRQRDTHIGSLEEVLRHRDSRIGDLETHSRNLQEVLRQRDTHIGSLEEVLRHRDSRIGDLETHSRNLQETLRQRDTHIGSLEEVLRQRDSRIGDLETHSRNLQETLRQRDAHIADLEEMLRQRDTHIGNLEVALQHRDARISDLETHSNNLAEVLRQRDTHIGNLEVTLQHRDTHIRNLEEVVQYRGARIGDLETHARNMEEVVRQRDETLHAIYTSHGWRLLSLYYRIRDRLLPANSARRKVIKYIWNLPKRNRDGKAPLLTAHNVKRGIFYLRKWELKTFIQKVREKMRSDTVACSSRPQTPALHLPMQPEDVIIPFQDVTVSVIIPTKNAGGEFELLMSVLSQQKGFKDLEIVVVDSGSSDGTLEIARSYGAKVVEIPSEKFSHSYARNLGAEHAIGNHLLFTVQDALPPSATWLYELAGKMKHTGVAALSCSETPREDVDMLYRVLSCNHMRFLEIDNGDRILSKPEKEDCVSLRKNGQLSDVACLIRKDIFEKYRYRYDYAEDLDLGLRLIKDGYSLALLGSAAIIHSHNRPCSYYLKRWYVETLTLPRIIPDTPVPHVEYTALLCDIVFTYYAICCIVSEGLFKGAMPAKTTDIAAAVSAAFSAANSHTFPETGVIDGNAYMDDAFRQFLKTISVSYSAASCGPAYRGALVPSMASFMGTVFQYLIDVYDFLDMSEIEEVKACMFKAFAFQCGAHLAYCYCGENAGTRGDIDFIHANLAKGI